MSATQIQARDKSSTMSKSPRIAVVIPCFKVKAHILDVIGGIGLDVDVIYAVDDCCPQETANFLAENCRDSRVRIIRNPINLGVGGAVMAGYRAAIEEGITVVVKVDGDGQMDPQLIPSFIAPILTGQADYTKGNRFFDLEQIRSMPKMRLFGNAVLSFMAKISTGYWDLFDPTNGYTAIHTDVAKLLPFDRISNRYFFETDMLFRLNTIKAVAVDVPMHAKYADEVSNLKISKIIGEFLYKHARNCSKRIFYNYYLRDLSIASIELPLGISMLAFGSIFGTYSWINSASIGSPTPAGTVMLAALPILVGIQLILAFLGYDIASVPRRVRHRTPVQSMQ
ncbi:glycosyltransferase family 2 protein [Paucibacter sp. Y2R2-4]|uniref:glycosyltransferase family 2 protein n=1 Tax=Paucibacter sp. Y2R2-4 TaxID=2893553 RepID=UPI0021E44CCA|nr:glycosyltransferase family 2 protein [Paucibacter sp. Y2R2-4]MCV2351392.1 glycosyltransferase family 2 protein [Paucibacter sp. Y2R2-4]